MNSAAAEVTFFLTRDTEILSHHDIVVSVKTDNSTTGVGRGIPLHAHISLALARNARRHAKLATFHVWEPKSDISRILELTQWDFEPFAD